MIKAYTKGLRVTLTSGKMITFLYLFVLLLALIISIPFFITLKNAINFSMSVYPLLHGFDYTSYEDFIRTSGKILKPFVPIGIWVSILYLIFSIFFSGGIIDLIYNNKKFSLKEFLFACGDYFLSFLRLALIVIPIQLLLVVIIYFPLVAILVSMSDTAETEAGLFYTFVTGAAVHLVLSGFILVIADYAKILMVANKSKKAFVSFWLAIKFFFVKIIKVIGLYVLLLIFPAVLIVAYLLFSESLFIHSKITFLIVVLVQQIFIWLRIFVKIWFLGSETFLITNLLGIEEEVKQDEEWNIEELSVDNG